MEQEGNFSAPPWGLFGFLLQSRLSVAQCEPSAAVFAWDEQYLMNIDLWTRKIFFSTQTCAEADLKPFRPFFFLIQTKIE